ncbi:MAG TPA: TolC family protein [Candidatus Acidoferrum sp.]|nr:TolC family protein [Candidatus Acidoferrum sp.]
MNKAVYKFRAVTLGAAIATVVALGGCVSAITPLKPADVPVGWQGPVKPDAPMWPQAEWWNNFGNDELTKLMKDIQASNFDLANVNRNLQSAQISLREAGYNLLPTPLVTVGTGASHTEIHTQTPAGTLSTTPSTPTTLTASFTYNDIISKPANYDKARTDYAGRVAQAQSLALNTLGTAASTYFQLLVTRDKIEVEKQNLANAEAVGAITQARVQQGAAVPIDALQQQIAIERERSNLRQFVQSELAAKSALALLQGRSVQGYDLSGKTVLDIKVPAVQPGIPSELLRRRPDLVLAEATLLSSNANLTIVHNSLFPTISLTGSESASSTALSTLVTSPTSTLNISATLVETLLDNGQRQRNIEQARITMENNLASYRKAVIGAFNDVDVQLSNIQLLDQQAKVASDNLAAAEEAFRIAQLRYGEGVTDYQTMLQTQNTLFTTRNTWLDSKVQQLNAVVSLYQALGGGWQDQALASNK